MLGIGRQTDYAARLLLHLACLEPEAQVTIAEVAAQRGLPAAFVRRLVGKLTRAGLLASVRGMGGGIRLARPASQITLLDLVQAMEGGVAINHCVDNLQSCPLALHCPVQSAWSDVTRSLESSLKEVTFARLAAHPSHHAAAHRSRAAMESPAARRLKVSGER
ncbi:MAG: Rrf2 family transcriptional regulator [Acidobacteria bacterium]|nr:Rrf2 family transcriptional regulator [Acidobacteriota bacterium]